MVGHLVTITQIKADRGGANVVEGSSRRDCPKAIKYLLTSYQALHRASHDPGREQPCPLQRYDEFNQ